jgi:hypothetical protein
VRVANLLVLDELLTPESAFMYTSDALNAELGAFDRIALMAVVDDVMPGVNTTPGFKVYMRHSSDGRNWLLKNTEGVAEIGGKSGILLEAGQAAYWGSDDGGPTLAFLQLAVELGSSAFGAHVRVWVTGRNLGGG